MRTRAGGWVARLRHRRCYYLSNGVALTPKWGAKPMWFTFVNFDTRQPAARSARQPLRVQGARTHLVIAKLRGASGRIWLLDIARLRDVATTFKSRVPVMLVWPQPLGCGARARLVVSLAILVGTGWDRTRAVVRELLQIFFLVHV